MSKATTKFAIAFAFKELLLEKSIDKITINDITEKCGINRQTFYYHFHDIYELIEWICETDADHVLKQNKTYDTWQEGFLAIFHLLKKDEPFVVNIYHNAPRGYIYRYLYKVTYQLIYNVLEEKAADMVVREEDKAFIADFYKYGFVGLVLEWIDKGMKEDPKQIIEIRTLIKNLKKKHTVILSSHILSEVSAVCDYVLIISHGKLVASDTPENLGKLAEGSNTLEMLVKGAEKPIKEALEGIEGINSVSLEHDDKQNLWSVKVTTEEQNDVREKVFYKMAEINCPIYEMKSKKVSLEEIFLELTASDQSVAVKTENEKTDNETQTQKESETEEDKDEGGKES